MCSGQGESLRSVVLPALALKNGCVAQLIDRLVLPLGVLPEADLAGILQALTAKAKGIRGLMNQ